MTPRQALNELAAPHRYRVALDPEGWPTIPGRYGRLEWHDGITLAVYSGRPRLFARLWAIPGIRRWQVGDQEVRGLVPVSARRSPPGRVGRFGPDSLNCPVSALVRCLVSKTPP